MEIPPQFPRHTPEVSETGGAIPRTPDFHINPDGTFCLGSPLRLKTRLHENADFLNFVEMHLDPFLFAVTYKLQNGGPFIFDELAHGNKGEITDYCDLLGMRNEPQVLKALIALSQKRRVANKRPCPCGCGNRLGVCKAHHTLNKVRKCAPRCDFADRHSQLVG
jgi:hypothetical protein